MPKFDDKASDDFEVYPVGEIKKVEDFETVSRIELSHREAKTRDRLIYISFALLVASLLAATLIGLRDGSFNEVETVWQVGAVPLGWMLKTYFSKG